MKITKSEWNKYTSMMSQLSNKASKEFENWVNQNGGWEEIDRQLLLEVGYNIASKYSEGSSTLAAEMYDSIARAEKVNVPKAEPSDNLEFGEVAKAINGALKHSDNDEFVSSVVGRAVKQTGADTMLKNATRDQAEFAWIPSGDSCAFCLTLAANGWQRASKKTTNGGHADHIHTNCDCQFVIRFSKTTKVEGYNPEEYQKIYYDAEGTTSEQKINSIRKMLKAQKEASLKEEESKGKSFIPLKKSEFTPSGSIEEAEKYATRFCQGSFGFNLTGKTTSFKGIDLENANKINEQLTILYDNFDIGKLSSLESFGKSNKKLYETHADAPFFTTNMGNVAFNNTILKDAKGIDNYNKKGEEAFKYVIDNIDKLSGSNLELAKTYIEAKRQLAGNTVEDMVTHEMGHHISYASKDINKRLSEIQKDSSWKEYAKHISGYANHSFGEYFSESLVAYCNGEVDILQPEILEVFENMRKY